MSHPLVHTERLIQPIHLFTPQMPYRAGSSTCPPPRSMVAGLSLSLPVSRGLHQQRQEAGAQLGLRPNTVIWVVASQLVS